MKPSQITNNKTPQIQILGIVWSQKFLAIKYSEQSPILTTRQASIAFSSSMIATDMVLWCKLPILKLAYE